MVAVTNSNHNSCRRNSDCRSSLASAAVTSTAATFCLLPARSEESMRDRSFPGDTFLLRLGTACFCQPYMRHGQSFLEAGVTWDFTQGLLTIAHMSQVVSYGSVSVSMWGLFLNGCISAPMFASHCSTSTGPFTSFPHFRNCNLGQLPCLLLRTI